MGPFEPKYIFSISTFAIENSHHAYNRRSEGRVADRDCIVLALSLVKISLIVQEVAQLDPSLLEGRLFPDEVTKENLTRHENT